MIYSQIFNHLPYVESTIYTVVVNIMSTLDIFSLIRTIFTTFVTILQIIKCIFHTGLFLDLVALSCIGFLSWHLAIMAITRLLKFVERKFKESMQIAEKHHSRHKVSTRIFRRTFPCLNKARKRKELKVAKMLEKNEEIPEEMIEGNLETTEKLLLRASPQKPGVIMREVIVNNSVSKPSSVAQIENSSATQELSVKYSFSPWGMKKMEPQRAIDLRTLIKKRYSSNKLNKRDNFLRYTPLPRLHVKNNNQEVLNMAMPTNRQKTSIYPNYKNINNNEIKSELKGLMVNTRQVSELSEQSMESILRELSMKSQYEVLVIKKPSDHFDQIKSSDEISSLKSIFKRVHFINNEERSINATKTMPKITYQSEASQNRAHMPKNAKLSQLSKEKQKADFNDDGNYAKIRANNIAETHKIVGRIIHVPKLYKAKD